MENLEISAVIPVMLSLVGLCLIGLVIIDNNKNKSKNIFLCFIKKLALDLAKCYGRGLFSIKDAIHKNEPPG